jgi:hypothetical protein
MGGATVRGKLVSRCQKLIQPVAEAPGPGTVEWRNLRYSARTFM